MDYTSHAAAVAIALGATGGLVGLFTLPALAIRSARRDAALAERAWVEIRAERRAAAGAATVTAVPTTAPIEPAQPAVAEVPKTLIGSQRREPVAH